ncbi:Cof-type HAD-IIB family hydrolase [Salsuginibacillus kocurii]|uniref:Cof-type HAD-IIB family hydrolase n=1 Tax=Salsuginibacillus kocurii TaxID=427078 RepID=UPI00037E0502|nr:Cof-type HAD-IIB family hydrolase [Salsuginibacillus kocurii]
MKKNCLIFDIDGTLFTDEKTVPPSTKLTLKKLQQAGYPLAIATGRAPFFFSDLRKELDISHYVSFNGSYVVSDERVIYEQALNPAALERLHEAATQTNHPMVFLAAEGYAANVENHAEVAQSLAELKLPYPPFNGSYPDTTTIYQALLYCKAGEESLYEENFSSFNYVRWHEYSVDVLPGGGSKAKGIQALASELGYSMDEVIAFGDGLNDIEMLREAGTGIAMGNAKQEAKAVADIVTAHVEEDGIQEAVQRLELL